MCSLMCSLTTAPRGTWPRAPGRASATTPASHFSRCNQIVTCTDPSALRGLCWRGGFSSHKTSSARYHPLLPNPVTTELPLFQRCPVGTHHSVGMRGVMRGICLVNATNSCRLFPLLSARSGRRWRAGLRCGPCVRTPRRASCDSLASR